MSNALTIIESDRLRELEATVRSGLKTFHVVGSALLQIRNEKLYRAQYDTFEDYCEKEWDMERARAYQLMDSAGVMRNLTVSKVTSLPSNERQARALTALPAEKQAAAWSEAVNKAPDGNPSGSLVQKIVDKIKGLTQKGASKGPSATKTSWTTDEVKKDGELYNALVTISAIFGQPDTKAIREGAVGYTRKDILALAKLTAEKMRECHDLIFENRWTPDACVRFLKNMPDDHTTIGELKNYCLATKGKCFQGDFDGFQMMFTLKRAARR